jgi:predicted transcriptional regulator
MDIIYAAGPSTATTILAVLSNPPTRTAVRTFLRILENKGHLTHTKSGREFVYAPSRPREKVARSALRNLLSTFFQSSLSSAVAAHLADPSTRLTDTELSELQSLITQARKKGR